MKIQLRKTLKNEQITLRVLLIIGILAFAFSLILEICIKPSICKSLLETLHIDYINNIMLGITGSSIISYLSLVFTFNYRKNMQIDSIVFMLKQIYSQYLEIYLSILNKSNTEKKTDNYFFEETLFSKVNILLRKIDEENELYSTSDFTSDVIEKINEVLEQKLTLNLLAVKEFCSFMLLQENNISENEADFLFRQSKLKDIITKRAERDCYGTLLEIIESIYTLKSLGEMFSKINPEDKLYEYNIEKFKDIGNDLKDLRYLEMAFAVRIKITNEITKIKEKHNVLYEEECQVIRNRLSKVIAELDKEINNNQDKQHCASIIEKVHVALGKDDLIEADLFVDELESILKVNSK